MVKQNREKLYGKYPNLKPTLGQRAKDLLSDAWNWLCKTGKNIANAASWLDNLVANALQKIGASIVTFWQEHKQQIIASAIIIATTALLVVALVGSGGLAAPALAATVATFFHISTALATKVVLMAVATTVISAAMNLWSTWGGVGSDSWLFKAVQTTLNVAVAIIATFTIVIPTAGLGMSTLIKDGITGITKLLGKNINPKMIQHFADVISRFAGYGGLTATTGGGLMTIADTWFNIKNDMFTNIREILTKVGTAMTTIYGIGLLWQSAKSIINKWKLRSQAPNNNDWSMDRTYGKKDPCTAKSHLIEKGKPISANGKGTINGSHRLDKFFEVISDYENQTGMKFENLNRYRHPSIEGIYQYEYKIPGTNTWQYKTVYDPSVISDSQIIQWAEEAFHNLDAPVVDRLFTGTASNGLQFEGYVNADGTITSIYPKLFNNQVKLPVFTFVEDNN